MDRHMTKIEKLLSEIKNLETPENSRTIKKLTEGINMIADEQRRRNGIILEAAKDIEEFDGAEDEDVKEEKEIPAEEKDEPESKEEKDESESKEEKTDKDDSDDIENSRYFERACLILYAKNKDDKPLTDWEAEILPDIIPLAEKLKEEMGDEKFDELVSKAKEAAKDEEEKETEKKEEKKEDDETCDSCCEDGKCCKDSDCPEGETCVNGECKKLTESEGFAQLDKNLKASGLSKKAFLEAVGETIVKSTVSDATKEKMFGMLEAYGRHLNSKTDAFLESMKTKFKESGMSKKAFIESVGKQIIKLKASDAKKEHMLESLSLFTSSLLEAEGTVVCRKAKGTLDESMRQMIAENHIDTLLNAIRSNSAQSFREAAIADFKNVEKSIAEATTGSTRVLVNEPKLKLVIHAAPAGGVTYEYAEIYSAR